MACTRRVASGYKVWMSDILTKRVVHVVSTYPGAMHVRAALDVQALAE